MPECRKGRGPTLVYWSYSKDLRQTKGNSQLSFALIISFSQTHIHTVHKGRATPMKRRPAGRKPLRMLRRDKGALFPLWMHSKDRTEGLWREVEKKHRYTFIYCRLYLDTHVECTCLAWEQNPPAEMRQQRSFDFSYTAAVALNWFCFKTHILQQIKWWHSAKAVYRTKTNKNVLNLNFKIYKYLQ